MKEICVGWTDCTTKLIKEAAKCRHWCSDMLYDIHDIMKRVELDETEIPDAWFGFRECGVDHADFIRERWNNKAYADEPYRKIYVLCTEYLEGNYYFTICEPDYEDLYKLKDEQGKNHD